MKRKSKVSTTPKTLKQKARAKAYKLAKAKLAAEAKAQRARARGRKALRTGFEKLGEEVKVQDAMLVSAISQMYVPVPLRWVVRKGRHPKLEGDIDFAVMTAAVTGILWYFADAKVYGVAVVRSDPKATRKVRPHWMLVSGFHSNSSCELVDHDWFYGQKHRALMSSADALIDVAKTYESCNIERMRDLGWNAEQRVNALAEWLRESPAASLITGVQRETHGRDGHDESAPPMRIGLEYAFVDGSVVRLDAYDGICRPHLTTTRVVRRTGKRQMVMTAHNHFFEDRPVMH